MDYSFFATLILLCLYLVINPVLSLECNSTTHYKRPNDNPQFCCSKCPPGQYMYSRDKKTCTIQCEPCPGERYTDSYNIGRCKVCRDCNYAHMELVSPCTSTQDAVCRCKAGSTCADEACTYCEESPVTQAPKTQTPSTTVSRPEVLPSLRASTTTTTTKPVQDRAWFLVIIGLLCLGIALVIVTRMKPVLNWFSNNKGHCLVKKPLAAQVSVLTEEEEEASSPVQEMCGKCDQAIDV